MEHSYGKQVLRLICSESYGGTSISQIETIMSSAHLLESELTLANYEINESNNFIKKKIYNDSPTSQVVIEYFFQ